jgi:trimethylamine---corrinoid protein Co-methyltransferase
VTEHSADRPRSRRRPTVEVPVSARSVRYRTLRRPYQPWQILSQDRVEALHDAALTLLEETGLKVLSARARTQYRRAGCAVDDETQMVRIDRALVAAAIASAPRSIALRARHAERHVLLDEQALTFGPVSGPPNVALPDGSRRPGRLQDYADGIRLCQQFDVIHLLGAFAEPQDVPVEVRQLEMLHAQLTLSDKIPHTYCRGSAQVADCFEQIRIANGLTAEEFRQTPCTYTIINTNSPRVLDAPMADGIMDFAAAGQVQMITPFTLAGAMAPGTITGALMLAHAETLGGLVLAQTTRAGAPVVYGSFTSNVDLRSGSPAFGTPEYVHAQIGAGQMARHVGLPWRSSGATASNVPDAQAAYESQMSLWGALVGGANFVLHGAGWLEGGLSSSFEKFILDIEQLQMLAEVLAPVGATADDFAAAAIAEAGPGGHFFGTQHTMARYRDAFYAPLVSDWRNHGAWLGDGAHTATERAGRLCGELLARFVPPPMDPAIHEELTAYKVRRMAEGGAPPAG